MYFSLLHSIGTLLYLMVQKSGHCFCVCTPTEHKLLYSGSQHSRGLVYKSTLLHIYTHNMY